MAQRTRNFTITEDNILVRLHAAGAPYAEIAQALPGRPENSLRDRIKRLKRTGQYDQLRAYQRASQR